MSNSEWDQRQLDQGRHPEGWPAPVPSIPPLPDESDVNTCCKGHPSCPSHEWQTKFTFMGADLVECSACGYWGVDREERGVQELEDYEEDKRVTHWDDGEGPR